MFRNNPANNYRFKVNNKITRTGCKRCSKSTTKTPERRQSRGSSVFIVNFEHISLFVLVLLLLTLSRWQTFLMKCFPEKVLRKGGKSFTIFAKLFILHVWQGFEYVFVCSQWNTYSGNFYLEFQCILKFFPCLKRRG